MPRPIHAAIYLAIATFLLSLVLRTWLVMGLIDPVTIAGSSMALAVRGPYVVATCLNCETNIPIGAEFARRTESVACPHCGQPRVSLAALHVEQADRLWIDRTVFSRRKPRRWEVVVLRQPDDGRQLCIKRIVGLPGETIRLAAGDVWVNGKVIAKPIEKQIAMRQLVSRASNSHSRWYSETEHAWQFSDRSWQHASTDNAEFDWLNFESSQPITDNVTYNASLSRRLNRVRDLMLSTRLQATGEGRVAFQLNDGDQSFRLTICPSTGEVTLSEQGQQLLTTTLSAETCRRLSRESISLVFSNFDRELLFVLDGQVELRHPLDNQSPVGGTKQPVAIGAQCLEISLRELALYRDVYYSSESRGSWQSEPESPILLGEGQYFVLGDNSPISVDSRIWGPISGRLLLGSPLGVR